MFDSIITARETEFLVDLLLAFICGALIGGERELKGKPAGISTQTLVISGAMLFAFLSRTVSAGDPTRIAAQIVSGIGFLGAGIILKSETKNKISNVTTAASIWYSAAIGMALGFNMHFIAVVAALYAVAVSRLPHLNRKSDD
jgi:putative Mg2+ transporter-C (MgtC) family protein